MSPIKLAFFGRAGVDLSTRGFRFVLTCPGMEVVSLTCGRGPADAIPDTELQALARAASIPILAFDEVERDVPEIDLVLSWSNPVLFPVAFTERIPFGVLNLHPSPLPAYRGCHGLEFALLHGDSEFGSTLHYCDASIDRGPIVEVSTFPITIEDDGHSLWKKIDDVAQAQLERWLPQAVAAAERGERLPCRPQGRGKYYNHTSFPEDSEIPAGYDLDQLTNFTRAVQHPRRAPAYIRWRGQRIVLGYEAGQVVVRSVVPESS